MSKEINVDGYRLAHTMIRVKDLEASFNFYCKTLGMKVLRKTDYPDGRFTNAFIGYGLETDEDKLQACIESGVPVIEQNIDNGLDNFQDQSFDTVIITQSIQELSNPRFLLEEIVRVGKQGIVTFPNFGYWRNRWMLATQGRMPESETIPHKWYSTPNIHLCTCIDFEMLCKENNIKITAKKMISHDKHFDWATKRWPNLFGELALYKIESNG